MEEIKLTTEDLELATIKANEMGALNHSYTKGAGNLVGQLGEIATCKYLGAKFGEATYQYDFIFNDLRIDVKTKGCTSKPRDFYFVGVNTCTPKQKCDIYLFTRVLKPSHDICWLLGWLPRDQFYDLAVFYKKGELDPFGDDIFRFREDGYQLPISELRSVKKLRG